MTDRTAGDVSLAELEAQLYSRNRIVGGRQRRRAVTALAEMEEAAVARILAEAVVQSADSHVQTTALQALHRWSPAVVLAGVHSVWQATGRAELLQLMAKKRLVQDGLLDSAENQLLFRGDDKGNIHVWDMVRHQRVDRYLTTAGRVVALATSHDGQWRASYTENKLMLWRVPRMAHIRTVTVAVSKTVSMQFTADGQGLLVQSHDPRHRTVTLYEIPSGKVRWESAEIWYGSATMTPDSQAIVMSGGKEVLFCQRQTGDEVLRLPHGADCIAFHPNNPTFAAHHASAIELWGEASLYQLLHKPLNRWRDRDRVELYHELARQYQQPPDEWAERQRERLNAVLAEIHTSGRPLGPRDA